MQKKQKRRPSARPEEILDAALAVFTAKGFAAARMDDIAEMAGLTKGSVYLYFTSKEQLFEALITRFADSFVSVMTAEISEMAAADPVDALRKAITAGFVMAADPKVSSAPRLVLAEGARFPEIAYMYFEKVISRGQASIRSILQSGQERGIFRRMDTDAALRIIIGPVLAHMILTHTFSRKTGDIEALANTVADSVVQGLRAEGGSP